jgi:uncharacterized membrane protein (Fun14 family)
MDTTLAGIISGIAGSTVCLVLGLIFRWTGLTDRTFDNLAQVFILTKEHTDALAFFMGSVVHLGIGGALGVIFAYFINATARKYIIIKGVFFGAMVFISFVGLGNYYRMALFTNMPSLASFLLWIASMIYGLTMSCTLRKLQ